MRARTGLPRPSVTTPATDGNSIPGVVAAALWLTFVGNVLRPLVKDVAFLRNGSRFLGELGALMLIATGLFLLVSQRPDPQRGAARFWTMAMLAACAPAAVAGLAYGNKFVLWAHLGFFPFATAAAIWLGAQRAVWDRVLKVLSTQLVLGAVFVVLVLIFDPPSSRLEWNGEDGIGLAKHATRSMYAMPFLLPMIDRMSTRRAVAVVVSFLLFLAMAIAGANRGQLLSGAFFPLLLVAISMRGPSGATTRFAKLAVATTLAVMVVVVVSGRGATYGAYFTNRWEELAARLTGGQQEAQTGVASRAALETSQEEFTGDDSRGGEIRAFIEQLTVGDYFAGRGWGGTWYSSYWGMEWGMVHIGPAHLVLEGGLPLMLVFLAMLAHALYSAWKGAARWPAAAGALVYLLGFTIGFIQHGAISDDLDVFFFWLVCGAAFAHRAMWRPVDDAPPAPAAQSGHLVTARAAR